MPLTDQPASSVPGKSCVAREGEQASRKAFKPARRAVLFVSYELRRLCRYEGSSCLGRLLLVFVVL